MSVPSISSDEWWFLEQEVVIAENSIIVSNFIIILIFILLILAFLTVESWAAILLYFGKTPTELDPKQVHDYLFYLQKKYKTPSQTYFKHGLTFLKSVIFLYVFVIRFA